MNEPAPDLRLPADIYQWILQQMLAALPPPLTNTPEACEARDRAAIAAVAALEPVNANEANLCTQSIIADAHARHCLVLACRHAANLKLLRQYNRLAGQLARSARASRALLLRAQAARTKRHAGKAPGASAARPRRRKSS